MTDHPTPSFIEVYPDVLGRDYCRLIIERFEADPRRRPSTVGRTIKREDARRSGTTLDLHDHMDDWADVVAVTHEAIAAKVAAYAGAFPALAALLRDRHIGSRYPRIERVDPGQGFDWHMDNAGSETAERVLACLLYLADVDEGGATEFQIQQTTVTPAAGTLVVFPPFWTHLHRGAPLVSGGPKYTMSFFWVYLDGGEPAPPQRSFWQRLTGAG